MLLFLPATAAPRDLCPPVSASLLSPSPFFLSPKREDSFFFSLFFFDVCSDAKNVFRVLDYVRGIVSVMNGYDRGRQWQVPVLRAPPSFVRRERLVSATVPKIVTY